MTITAVGACESCGTYAALREGGACAHCTIQNQMKKKILVTRDHERKQVLRERLKGNMPNLYHEGNAEPDCLLRVTRENYTEAEFSAFVRRMKAEGIYYSHDVANRVLVLAFATKEMRDRHADALALQAFANQQLKHYK